MAKGNFLLGTLSGSIGDITFSRQKGQQVERPRIRRVANPRSNGQSYQRARFSNCVKFYTRGNQAFYKFAFETKKSTESDYNAFMRENVKRSPLISKPAFDLYGYPAIGDFVMSKGTLPQVRNRIVNDYFQSMFNIVAPDTMPTTVGELSSLLINSGNFQSGDILTFVFITTIADFDLPDANPVGNADTRWLIKQFFVSESDTTTLESLAMRAVTRNWEGRNYLTITDAEDEQILTGYAGYVCIHSRNTTSGLKVSTQELALSEGAIEVLDRAREQSYINEVIETWKKKGEVPAQPDAILKGAIAYGEQQASPIDGIYIRQYTNPEQAVNFTRSGNSFYADANIPEGADIDAGQIFGTKGPLVPGMFQIYKVSGAEGAEVSLDQEDENTLTILVSNTSGSGSYQFRIMYQQIPICYVNFTVGEV